MRGLAARLLKPDLILIHPPSVFDFRDREQFHGPIADVIPSTDQFEMYPIGLTSIAEYLARNGYDVHVLNLACRMLAERGFDALGYLRAQRAPVYGIDLHWLPHAQGALAVARVLKRLHPESRVLMGGLSASYYHEELAADPAVDFVLRGDSTEEPCRQLLQSLREGRPLQQVENLTWKLADGTVAVNPLTYVPHDLDAFEVPAYRHVVRSVFNHGRMADWQPYLKWWKRPLTVLLNARGCSLECAVCGGSRSAYASICGRAHPAWRAPERMLDDLRVICSFSRSPVFVVHDPRMGGARRARRLFDLLAQAGIENELVFELFYPAREDFFRMLASSVRRWSIQVTLETQEERLRAANGKFASSNQRVEETIAFALAHGCRKLDLFFMVGVPGQTYESALGIADYCERLLARFGGDGRVRPFVAPLAPFLDPGSRAFEDPGLGYKSLQRTLAEHEAALLEADWTRTLTFESDAMTREQMVAATYAVTARLNDLNLRYGLIHPEAHDALARSLTAAVAGSATHGPTTPDTTWMFHKDEMDWPGRQGVRPTPRLAWILLGGFFQELKRMAGRAAGRYDLAVAR